MKKILLFIILLFCFTSNGQERYSYEFEKLAVTDTIYNKETITFLKSDSEFIYADYFLVSRHFEGEIDGNINCLIKAKKDYYISYALPYEYGPGNSTSLIGPSENKKYFFASSYYNHLSHGGGHGNENTIQKLIIVDVQAISCIQIETYTEDKFWETADNGDESSGKEVMISNCVLTDKYLTILNTCSDDEGVKNCSNLGGLYEFKNQELRKIKNYDPNKMGFKMINYIGNIAVGMTLKEIDSVFPSNFIEKQNIYGTCADTATGFEIWNNNKIIGFALTKEIKKGITEKAKEEYGDEYIDTENLKTYEFVVLSSEFNFDKININTTVGEVLKLYPKANVRLDTLTEWEHIYIEELNIELVFKTDESNRICVYKDETFVKLKNKKVKPDFIVVSD